MADRRLQTSTSAKTQTDILPDHDSKNVCCCSCHSQNNQSSSEENLKSQPELPALTVPEDWEFNDLLANIAREMTIEDLEEMKSRVKGEGGLGRHVLESIKNGHELFDIFQRHQLTDRDNLLILQALLHRMQKPELFELAVRYAQTVGNVLHFKIPPTEPRYGYQTVKIHVHGRDFRQYTCTSVEGLRTTMARLMFVEPSRVFITGIEPSSSLLITIIVPESFVGYLRRSITEPQCIKEWTSLGVDYILIDNRKYSVMKANTEMVENEAEQRLEVLFQKYEDIKQQLDSRDVELLLSKRTSAEYTPIDNEQTFLEKGSPFKTERASNGGGIGDEKILEKGQGVHMLNGH